MPPRPKIEVHSVQPKFTTAPPTGGWAWVDTLFNWGTKELPAYGSIGRDLYLAEFWPQEPTIAGVFSSFADKVQAIPWWCIGPRNRTIFCAQLCLGAEGGLGYDYYIGMEALDYLCCDKGPMTELFRGAPGAVVGPVSAIQHIDATRMVWLATKESNLQYMWHYIPEYEADVIPVPDENLIQIIPAPSGRDRFWRNGRCATSRLHDSVSLMVGFLTYWRERVGSLPPEIIGILNNMDLPQLKNAYTQYKSDRESNLITIYPGIFWLGSHRPEAPITLELHFLKQLPELFDMNAWAEWWVKEISLNVGQDVGEYWLIQQSGATKALQGIQHMKSRGKGPGRFVSEHENRMNRDVMLNGVRFRYDFQDDEQDKLRADIIATRVDTLYKLAEIKANEAAPLPVMNVVTEAEGVPPPTQNGAAVFTGDEIRRLAYEWEVIPPEMAGIEVPHILGVVIKGAIGNNSFIDTEPIVRVGADLRPITIQPLITHRKTAEKLWQVAQMLDHIAAKQQLAQAEKGGPGSGFFGHAGRPGERGGSLPSLRGVIATAWKDVPRRLKELANIKDAVVRTGQRVAVHITPRRLAQIGGASLILALGGHDLVDSLTYATTAVVAKDLIRGYRERRGERVAGAELTLGTLGAVLGAGMLKESVRTRSLVLDPFTAVFDLLVGSQEARRMREDENFAKFVQDSGIDLDDLTGRMQRKSYTVKLAVERPKRLRSFDPAVDEGLPDYEIVARERNGGVEVDLIPAETTREEATRLPWFYFVIVEEETTRGGPGSGYFRHLGRPGKRGGSLPRGGLLGKLSAFKRREVDSWRKAAEMTPDELYTEMTGPVREEESVELVGISAPRYVVSAGGLTMVEKPSGSEQFALTEPGELEGSAIFDYLTEGRGSGGREVAYGRVADIMGVGEVVPPTVLLESGRSRQLFVPQAREPKLFQEKGLHKGSRYAYILDRLTNHPDRHSLNMLVDNDNNFFAIDNSYSFGARHYEGTTHLDDDYINKEIRRPWLTFSEHNKVLRLMAAQSEFDPELRALVGEEAADRFWERASLISDTHYLDSVVEEFEEFPIFPERQPKR